MGSEMCIRDSLNLTLALRGGHSGPAASLEEYLLSWAEEDYSTLGEEQDFWPQDSRWSADVRRALHPVP